MTSFARLERVALCQTARAVGPDAPTLCSGWSVRDLISHLLVRERRPWASLGVVVPALEGMTRRARASYADRPFEELLDVLAVPPLVLRPEVAERLVNAVELFVHHEDIRRAQPDWTPRALPADGAADLWRAISVLGRLAARRGGIPLRVTDGTRTMTLLAGPDPAVLTAPVSELLLFLTGRDQLHGMDWSGPPQRVEAVKAANRSV
jgi:uncharacterized protein (TIGR03085 family)